MGKKKWHAQASTSQRGLTSSLLKEWMVFLILEPYRGAEEEASSSLPPKGKSLPRSFEDRRKGVEGPMERKKKSEFLQEQEKWPRETTNDDVIKIDRRRKALFRPPIDLPIHPSNSFTSPQKKPYRGNLGSPLLCLAFSQIRAKPLPCDVTT